MNNEINKLPNGDFEVNDGYIWYDINDIKAMMELAVADFDMFLIYGRSAIKYQGNKARLLSIEECLNLKSKDMNITQEGDEQFKSQFRKDLEDENMSSDKFANKYKDVFKEADKRIKSKKKNGKGKQ